VGEIRDEYDLEDGSEVVDESRIDGGTSIEDFAEGTGVVLPDHGGYETVAGYVIARLGRIPQVGDTVDAGDATIRVVAMTGRRVTQVALRRNEEQPPPSRPDPS
jgi:putative hemolysin